MAQKTSISTIGTDGYPGRCTPKKAAQAIAKGIAHQREDGVVIFLRLDLSSLRDYQPRTMWPATLPDTIERTAQHEQTSDSGFTTATYPQPMRHQGRPYYPAIASPGAGLGGA